MNVKKSTISLMMKYALNQPFSKQAKIFEESQSYIDDATDFSGLLTHFIDSICVPILSMSLSIKSKGYIDLMSLIVFIPLPVVCYVIIKQTNLVKQAQKELRKTRNQNRGQVSLAIQRNHLIKAYNKIDYEINEVYKQQNQQSEKLDDVSELREKRQRFLQLVQHYREIASYFVIIKQIYREVFTVDMSKDYLVYTREMYQNFSKIFDFIGQFNESKLIYKNVTKVFMLEQEVPHYESFSQILGWLKKISTGVCEEKIDSQAIELEFQNVCFSYSSQQLIENFTQKFEFGKTYAIIGKTGCGKSTISNLAIQLIKQKSGEIKINSQNIQQMDLSQLRTQITVCSQNDPVIKGWTLKQNMSYGEQLTDDNLTEIMNLCEIDFIQLDTIVGELSGGQKQRISLARALSRQSTRILILDETTSALDDQTETKILEKLKPYCHNRKILLIFIAHKQHVIDFVDEVVNLDQQQ